MWFLQGKFHYINNSRTKDEMPSIISGLDISTHPLAQVSVKGVGRAQIIDHSPGWRVRFLSQRIVFPYFPDSLTNAYSPGKFKNE